MLRYPFSPVGALFFVADVPFLSGRRYRLPGRTTPPPPRSEVIRRTASNQYSMYKIQATLLFVIGTEPEAPLHSSSRCLGPYRPILLHGSGIHSFFWRIVITGPWRGLIAKPTQHKPQRLQMHLLFNSSAATRERRSEPPKTETLKITPQSYSIALDRYSPSRGSGNYANGISGGPTPTRNSHR